jgi:hypothetical protein
VSKAAPVRPPCAILKMPTPVSVVGAFALLLDKSLLPIIGF